VLVLLNSPGERFLWRDGASNERNWVKSPFGQQYSLNAFHMICPTVHLQPDASPEPLQIPTALIPRGLPAVDGEHMGSMDKPGMNNIKSFSYH
jgi:hypothetical protein